MKRYFFKRYTDDTTTRMLWADSLVTAYDKAGAGWSLFMISK